MLRAAVTAPKRAPLIEDAPRRGGRFARERPVPGPWYKRVDWWHVAPVAIAILFAIGYLI